MKRRKIWIMVPPVFLSLIVLCGASSAFLFSRPGAADIQRKIKKTNRTFASHSEETFPERVVLGNERLFSEYTSLINHKKIGIITNQTGINAEGETTYEKLAEYKKTDLQAIFVPEHGLNGYAAAGAYVESYEHPVYKIPVYSLYSKTRKPTYDMVKNLDVVLFDIQDIGSRAYTYISTLNYAMKAAAEYHFTIVVLDRPNPLGDRVEGFVLEESMESFVGVDTLPLCHGMTVGELAQYFNREIGADLIVIPMKHYFRDMIYQETGLPWTMTSPNIPDIDSAFCYMATGMGEGTGIYQEDKFKWIGSKRLKDAGDLVYLLNKAELSGVVFNVERFEGVEGIRLNITDYSRFNPCLTGIYLLSYSKMLTDFSVPEPGYTLFERVWGTERMGKMLTEYKDPEEIRQSYQGELNHFLEEREPYLIYQKKPADGF